MLVRSAASASRSCGRFRLHGGALAELALAQGVAEPLQLRPELGELGERVPPAARRPLRRPRRSSLSRPCRRGGRSSPSRQGEDRRGDDEDRGRVHQRQHELPGEPPQPCRNPLRSARTSPPPRGTARSVSPSAQRAADRARGGGKLPGGRDRRRAVLPGRHQGRAADAAEQGEDDEAAHQLGASLPRPISERRPPKRRTGPGRVKDAVEQGRVRRARSGGGIENRHGGSFAEHCRPRKVRRAQASGAIVPRCIAPRDTAAVSGRPSSVAGWRPAL